MRPARPSSPSTLLTAAAIVGAALTSASARAGEPVAPAEISTRPPAIIGGEASEPCAWPSVVALQGGGLCTGTLIHPRVVAYAAHCGTFHTKVYFGERADSPAREVETLFCERNSPLFAVSSEDYAFCVLAEPVTELAITPPLVGCDEDLIAVGTPVTIVGFGDSASGEAVVTGVKHEAVTEIQGILSTIGVGGMGTGADAGDSGGPAFVALDDGSWRMLGIVSGGGGDGATVQYVPAPDIIAWIEDRTGIDVSPCHAGDGSWAPTPACEGFYVATEAGASWDQGCPSQRSAASDRCGPAWTELDDELAPTVGFISPVEGEPLLGPPSVFDVVGEADDGEGSGVVELRLLVDGQPWLDSYGQPARDQVPPYRFPAIELGSAGPHTLTLEARDALGNLGEAQITVQVGSSGAEETTDEGESGSEEAVAETETDAGTEDDAGPGCACRVRRGPGGPAPLPFALVALLGWRLGLARRRAAVLGP